MANGVNKVILVGRVGKDPELRFTTGGTGVAKFSMATAESWGKGEAKKDKTEWHNIVAWGKLAEICGQYVKKGDLIYIEGKISSSDWTDKDGLKRYRTEINANILNMLGNKNQSESKVYEKSDNDVIVDDEVPF